MTLTREEPQRPSAEMLRQLTDRRVFEQLLGAEGLTRAEIAARTGISKPTISDSVRRLIESGTVSETGLQLGGRGRAGTYIRLRPEAAAALAVSVGPDGVVVDTVDLLDQPVAHVEVPVPAPVDGATLEPILLGAVTRAVQRTPGAVRSCVVSLAGPADRRTGRFVELPHSPFLVGELDPKQILSHVAPTVEVDNDVNWAAVAEHHHGNATDLDDFVLCYLGAGIGGAIVINGTIVAGSRGMAGELAHARTTGPAGRSLTLVECFAAWDLLRPGSDAIDVDRVRGVLESGLAGNRRRQEQIAAAVAGALSSVIALLDPKGVLVGGPWGSADGLLQQVAERIEPLAHPELVLRPVALVDAPYRDGIRLRALAAARQAVAAGL